jgi:hypothetical protein
MIEGGATGPGGTDCPSAVSFTGAIDLISTGTCPVTGNGLKRERKRARATAGREAG